MFSDFLFPQKTAMSYSTAVRQSPRSVALPPMVYDVKVFISHLPPAIHNLNHLQNDIFSPNCIGKINLQHENSFVLHKGNYNIASVAFKTTELPIFDMILQQKSVQIYCKNLDFVLIMQPWYPQKNSSPRNGVDLNQSLHKLNNSLSHFACPANSQQSSPRGIDFNLSSKSSPRGIDSDLSSKSSPRGIDSDLSSKSFQRAPMNKEEKPVVNQEEKPKLEDANFPPLPEGSCSKTNLQKKNLKLKHYIRRLKNQIEVMYSLQSLVHPCNSEQQTFNMLQSVLLSSGAFDE
jgi:hypothetical protein